MGKMDISVYMKGDYEDIYGFVRRENKANSKPNKANMPAFDRKSEARISKSEIRGIGAK